MPKQQTGFRADRDLLNQFRSRLALEGRDMGETIEKLIHNFMSIEGVCLAYPGAVPANPNRNDPNGMEFESVQNVLLLLRSSVPSANLIRQIIFTQLQLIQLTGKMNEQAARSSSAKPPAVQANIHAADSTDRTGTALAQHRMAEAQSLAVELKIAAGEARNLKTVGVQHGSGTEGRRKGLGK